jgi:hypothetical protein
MLKATQRHGAGQADWQELFFNQANSELAHFKPQTSYPFRPRCLHSESAVGRRILQAAERSDEAAIGMLAWEIGLPLRIQTPNDGTFNALPVVAGYLEARLQEGGLSETVESERATLNSLARDWSDRVSKTVKLYEEETKRAADKAQHYEQRLKSIRTAAVNVSRKQREEHRAAMEAIRSTYKQEMQLRAPVAYWARKRSWNIGGSIGFALLFLTLVACAVLLIVFEAMPAMDDFISSAVAAAAAPAAESGQVV